MHPKTPHELTQLLVNVMTLDLYGEITTAARKKRLTEHDIAAVERKVIAKIKDGPDFSHEALTYEAEPAIARAIAMVKDFTETAARGRKTKILKESGK
ncbi:hypothetical protein [Martelella sp. AMO21009]